MNTKNNQRARSTDESIVRTVYGIMVTEKKPASKITVREVCEKAQINRSTFYAHFLDVYDVVEKVERNMAERLTKTFLQKLEEGAGLDVCYASLFDFVREYKEFYRLYFSAASQSGLIGVAWDLLRERTGALSWEQFGYESKDELIYHGEFFIYGMSAMLRCWIERDCKETPEELLAILKRQYAPRLSLFQWDKQEPAPPQESPSGPRIRVFIGSSKKKEQQHGSG